MVDKCANLLGSAAEVKDYEVAREQYCNQSHLCQHCKHAAAGDRQDSLCSDSCNSRMELDLHGMVPCMHRLVSDLVYVVANEGPADL